jgi:hypothetical protein
LAMTSTHARLFPKAPVSRSPISMSNRMMNMRRRSSPAGIDAELRRLPDNVGASAAPRTEVGHE